MTPETKAMLEAARAKIADSAHWTKGQFASNSKGDAVNPSNPEACKWCTLGALESTGANTFTYLEGVEQLRDCLPADTSCNVPDFNDDPSTRHADILALFDRAIAGEVTVGRAD